MTCRSENLAALEDAELVERHLEGNPHAFMVLYLRHDRKLRARLYTLARNWDDANDLAQDAWERVTRFELDPTKSFTGLLNRSATLSVMANWNKARKRGKITAALILTGGQVRSGDPSCRYCDRRATINGMCGTHDQRKRRGATEEQMRKPIQERRRGA